MAFEDRKKIYTEHLETLSEFPVWTIDQIKQFLHLDFDTVQKFVAAKWLYKFNVGRCTFYSCNNKKFTNQAIIKSIMMIDTHYYVDYSQYEEWLRYGSTLENKSLLARGVRHIGYMDNSYHTNIQVIFVLNLNLVVRNKASIVWVGSNTTLQGRYNLINIFFAKPILIAVLDTPGEGNGIPLQYSCLENPMDRGACGLQSMGLHRVGHD